MTEIKKLKDHQYSQCRVWESPEQIAFVSYNTTVIVADLINKTIECSGTYSATTRKQIGWFLKEYFPQFSYFDMKRIAQTGEILKF